MDGIGDFILREIFQALPKGRRNQKLGQHNNLYISQIVIDDQDLPNRRPDGRHSQRASARVTQSTAASSSEGVGFLYSSSSVGFRNRGILAEMMRIKKMEVCDDEVSSAEAYHSHDFRWESLRDEVEGLLERTAKHDETSTPTVDTQT